MYDRMLLFQGATSSEAYYISTPTDGSGTYQIDVANNAQTLNVDSAGEISLCASQYDFINGVGPFTISRFTGDGTAVISKSINVSLIGQVMARDSAGNYYIASVANSTAFYLFKLDSSGAITWQKTITTPTSTAFVTGIRVDSTDANVYICGYRTVSATNYAFLVKITSAGAHSFTRVASTASQFNSMTIDSSDNVYCCGYYGASGGMLVMKFTSTGTTSFTRRYYLSTGSTTVLGYGQGIACDNTALYVSGTFNGLQHVLEMDLTGVITWSRYSNVAIPFREAPASVGYDSSGNVYMGQGDGSTAYTIYKFDGSGNLSWQRKITSSNIGISGENIIVKNSIVYATASKYDGAGNNIGIYLNKVPSDGTLTNGGTYTAASYTVGAAPATINQAATTVTVGTTAFTRTTPTFAVSTDNVYLNKTTVL